MRAWPLGGTPTKFNAQGGGLVLRQALSDVDRGRATEVAEAELELVHDVRREGVGVGEVCPMAGDGGVG